MKLFRLFIFLFVCIFVSCKSKKQITDTIDTDKITYPLQQNDSVGEFKKYDQQIADRITYNTSHVNPISLHFQKYISKHDLKKIEFEEWRRKIYIEFSLDDFKKIIYSATNTNNKKLNDKIQKAFRKLDFNLLNIENFDSRYMYTLVIAQQENGETIIKCSSKAMGYIPPVYKPCAQENTYKGLNNCNFMYISDYMYNHTDITDATDVDIDKNHSIIPKFIIGPNKNVVAAKVESQNKDLAEAYFKTLKTLPKAKYPARLNGQPYYYGYNYPTTLGNLIRNNTEFRAYYYSKKDSGERLSTILKMYIHKKYLEREQKKINRVGF